MRSASLSLVCYRHNSGNRHSVLSRNIGSYDQSSKSRRTNPRSSRKRKTKLVNTNKHNTLLHLPFLKLVFILFWAYLMFNPYQQTSMQWVLLQVFIPIHKISLWKQDTINFMRLIIQKDQMRAATWQSQCAKYPTWLDMGFLSKILVWKLVKFHARARAHRHWGLETATMEGQL